MNPDELSLPFRPRARLLQLLGDQLIGSPRLAVFELVKNAYDADATRVTVSLKHLDSPEATIEVEDDGDGMSLETIRDIWLVPAHDHRDLQRKSLVRTKRNRLPLGEKGVGRFAVHKLGERIELVTRAADQLECVVTIDWDDLIKKPFLSDANVTVRTRAPQVFVGTKTGTKLVVGRLRETAWSRGEIRRLLRQVTSISSPFEDRSDKFDVELQVPEHPDWIRDVPDVQGLMNRAPWHFWFKFDGVELRWGYSFRGVTGLKIEPRKKNSQPSERLLIVPERDVDVFGFPQGTKKRVGRKRVVADSAIANGIGPVSGEFYVYDRDRNVLSRLGDSELLETFLDENGGVRVYRDKIRVYNYGEPGDDWLGLDLRRVNTPTRNISRNIVIGAIDLSLEKSTGLREKTNREGFVESDVLTHLKQIVLGALAQFEIERKIDKDKIRALFEGGTDVEARQISQPLDKLRAIAKKHRLSEEIEPLIDKVEKNYTEFRDSMLRAGLTGMGLAAIFHEIERGVRVLRDAIEKGINYDSIKGQARELVHILDGFTELLRKGEPRKESLKHVIRRARDINRIRFRNHKVRLVCPALEDSFQDVERMFVFGLVLGALNNLLDNAFYWLQVRWPEDEGSDDSERTIFISINADDFPEGPAIVVADNGPGLQDDPDLLIRPFFSRRPDGMGVGLYYANMVMELSGGRLAFPETGQAAPEQFDGAAIALVFGKEKRK